MGGDGPTTFDRVIEFCNSWMPLGYRVQGLAEKISTLRRRAEKAGRDPQSISVTVFGAKPEREAIEQFESMDVGRVIFMLPAEGRDTVLPLLDKYVELTKGH
jgi:alkanesulfonate monooxygenase SsuD/methylene tetrahydromethanopterin reductase-like flavin-dependent oxidoreductase (luciferase family)